MSGITDDRLIVVLAAYEAQVDRVLQQIRDEPDEHLAAAGSGAPTDPDAGTGGGGPLGLPLRALGTLGRGARDHVLDPILGRVVGRTHPGAPEWAEQTPHDRAQWWTGRIALWAAGPAALPWVAGKLSDRVPVKDALSAAAQGLVVCAVSREYGIEDADRRISLLAEVLAGRAISPDAVGAVRARRTAEPVPADEVPVALERDVDELVAPPRRGVVRRAGGALWTLARIVWEVPGVLDHREQGHLAARLLGALPVVGVVGGYLAEHSGLRRAGARTERLLTEPPGSATPVA